jgi:hypothetical protein
MTTITKEEKVYNLVQELDELKKKKKSSAKMFRNEIKRLEDEINNLINPEGDEEEDSNES